MSSTKSQQHKSSNIQLFVCINPLVLCDYSKVKTNLTEVISFCRIKYILLHQINCFLFSFIFSQVFRYDDIQRRGLCLQADGCRGGGAVLAIRCAEEGAVLAHRYCFFPNPCANYSFFFAKSFFSTKRNSSKSINLSHSKNKRISYGFYFLFYF